MKKHIVFGAVLLAIVAVVMVAAFSMGGSETVIAQDLQDWWRANHDPQLAQDLQDWWRRI